MKLSAKLLYWHLQQEFNVSAAGSLSEDPLLRYPVYRKSGQPDTEGLVFVTDNAEFIFPARRVAHTLIILTGPSAREIRRESRDFLMIPEADPAEVVFCLQQVFDRYNEWNQKLFESRMGNASIQNLLEISESVIPNSLSVMGLDFSVLAARGKYEADRGSVIGSSEEGAKLVNALKQDPNYTSAPQHTGWFFYPGNAQAGPSLCVNIRQSGQAVYRLVMTPGELPLDETCGFLLEYLAGIITNALSTKAPVGKDGGAPLRHIFSTLLTDSAADYVEMSRQLSACGWLSGHRYICIYIKTGMLDYKNLTLRSICGYIENNIPSSCAVEHRGNVVAYVNIDLCSIPESDILPRLASFIRDSMLNAAVSRCMMGHFNFQRMYVQSMVAMRMGLKKNPSFWIHRFNDIALPYLLEQTTQKLPAYMVGHEELLTLKYQSENHHTQLYQTLRCYMECNQNVTETARKLFIHRSTLLYRLEKIKEVIHANLEDPETIFYMLLTFRLMEQDDDD